MQKRSVNKVILVGRVGQSPEGRYTPSGLSVVNYSLATNDTKSNSDGNKIDHTEWHNIVSLGKQADFVTEYVKKGQLICIEGKLRTQKWEDKNKVTHYKTEILADSVTPLEWKQDNEKVEDKVSEPAENEEELPF
ncbi:MAG: single-stranded DNA-binding protein [Candidatus Marinimicrobia bacterium]|nr:single-stranded DNA-binding protein [Candidatus Neomarinimicrobiota bacterium]